MDYCYEVAVRNIASDNKGRTLLHWAAKCNQAEAVIDTLIADGSDINDANNPFQVTPLYMAAMEGSAEAAKTLIQKGADINAKAINGAVAIHAAAESGDVATLKTMIEAGADVNAGCQMGGTPLVGAAQRNNLPVLKTLIVAGADVNVCLVDGGTALMVAAQFGFADFVKELLANGADKTLSVGGKTALDAAKANQHQAVVDLLS